MTISDIQKQKRQVINNLDNITAGKIALRLKSYNIPVVCGKDKNGFRVDVWCEETRWNFIKEELNNVYEIELD